MELNEKIRKYRLENHLSQEELASKIFVSRTLISKYESGAVFPTHENLHKLAEVFGIKDEELLSDQEKTALMEKAYQTSNRTMFVLAIIALVVSLLLLIFLFIPWYELSHYDYSHVSPGNSTPVYTRSLESIFTASLKAGAPLAVISTTMILLLSTVSAVISLFANGKNNKKLFLIISLVILLIAFFFLILSFIFMIMGLNKNY